MQLSVKDHIINDIKIIIAEKIKGGDFFQQAKRTLVALASARLYLCFLFEFFILYNQMQVVYHPFV
ncbi:hypothetical protein LS48_00215 [Aequorivita aquimaris]|uniref:Uncharacterized protein n=1 Tax=Aequorivita aquimaris TaxID=1548749 RepID=A0A137RLD3_9FLAO|nr:hypothetical protein LS48_00215 [Aequorivita aquimaris]